MRRRCSRRSLCSHSSRFSACTSDAEGDDFSQEAAHPISVQASIESMGRHVPICVARSLEDHPEVPEVLGRRGGIGHGGGGYETRRLSWTNTTTTTGGDSRSSFQSAGSWSSFGPNGGAHTRSSSIGSQSSRNSEDTDRIVHGRHPMPSPKINKYQWTVLLLVDISGFTALSTLLDVESLSKTINDYFERLVSEVERAGGDVLKFAGDAFFASWSNKYADEAKDLEEEMLSAAICGASIVRKYSNFRVRFPSAPSEVVSLDVHCGVGVGQIAALHLGDNETRREFVFLGDPIDQVSKAEGMATNGELAASPEAIALLSQTCDISEEICSSGQPAVIASEDVIFFEPLEPVEKSSRDPQPYRLNYLSSNIMEPLRQQMSLYVHPAARKDTARGDFQSRAIADAEIRSVYTIFVKAQIDARISGELSEDRNLFSLLNDIMGITSRVLDRYRGHLRQFIVDDKGVVLIATFGQRGASFPNMVSEKGLPATIALFDALKIDSDVDCRIGATFGKAYCGVVGGIRRHEFTILGPSVNLAARLMCSKGNHGILVDDAVRQMASQRFNFLSHPPVEAKGYTKRVPIFEPHTAIERRWISSDNFVGREAEVNRMVRIGRRQLRSKKDTAPQIVLVQAHSGLGKSALALQAIEKVRRIGGKYGKHTTIKKNICKDGEQSVPFCVFRQIILDLITERDDDDGYGDEDTESLSSESSLSLEGLEGDLRESGDILYHGRLRALCSELNYTEDFADSVAEHMLLLGPSIEMAVNGNAKKKLSPDDVVDFVADVFLACTSQSDFVLLALDDVQWIDTLSWKVVERLVTRGKRLMIILLSRPLTTSNVDTDFLEGLPKDADNDEDAKKSQFTPIELEPLTELDVRALLALGFECEAGLIHGDVITHLYDQSGGMPYFVQEIVRSIIEKDLLEWQSDGSVGWRSDLKDAFQNILFANINELLLHRLDNFNSDARTLLQVCAILGFDFSLSELLMVQCQGRGKRRRKERREIQDVLNSADKERILLQSCEGGVTDTDQFSVSAASFSEDTHRWSSGDMSYTFSHAIWRKCVLGTMLEERKRELHKKVACALEGTVGDELSPVDLISAMKLFGHWKEGGDLMKATSLARRIGTYLDSQLLVRQSIDVCLEAIELWQPNDESDENCVAGISRELILKINPEELECLARIHIEVARRGDTTRTRSFYQNCYDILSNSPAADNLKDRSVYFALYSGLFILYKNGVLDDDKFTLEDLAKGFVRQAEIHGDPVHIARAIAMEGLTMASMGKYEEAIAVQKRLEEVYSAERLSEGICRAYATDRAAHNYGYSVSWYELLGRRGEAQAQIEFVLQQLMPRMPAENVHNSMILLFPVIWVLVEIGEARKAESIFMTHVYDCFHEFYGKDSTTFFFCMYEPLRALLYLAGDAQEGRGAGRDKRRYAELEDWVMSDEFGSIKKYISTTMCPYGMEPHCALADICFMLAMARENGEKRKVLLERGLEQAQISLVNTQGNPGYEYARRQSEKVVGMFRSQNVEH